jgi:hypothetical protein
MRLAASGAPGLRVAHICELAHKFKKLSVYKNSVRTSKETQFVCPRKINRFMLFRETATVYCENYTTHINTLCGQNEEFSYVKVGGVYTNHWTLKG